MINGLTFFATGLYFFFRDRSVGKVEKREESVLEGIEEEENEREDIESKDKEGYKL